MSKFIIGNILVIIPEFFMVTLAPIFNEPGNNGKSITKYGQLSYSHKLYIYIYITQRNVV